LKSEEKIIKLLFELKITFFILLKKDLNN